MTLLYQSCNKNELTLFLHKLIRYGYWKEWDLVELWSHEDVVTQRAVEDPGLLRHQRQGAVHANLTLLQQGLQHGSVRGQYKFGDYPHPHPPQPLLSPGRRTSYNADGQYWDIVWERGVTKNDICLLFSRLHTLSTVCVERWSKNLQMLCEKLFKNIYIIVFVVLIFCETIP